MACPRIKCIFMTLFMVSQIDGLCKLLAQHCRMLTSLEFVHCTLSTDFINAIFGSLVIERVQKHGIQHLSIIATSFLEPCTVSLPSGLVSFLSSGRYMGVNSPFYFLFFVLLLATLFTLCSFNGV